MNIQGINTLAALLENIPSKLDTGFNMETYSDYVRYKPEVPTNVSHQCGTTACIAGWASQFLSVDGLKVLKQPRRSDEIWRIAGDDAEIVMSSYASVAQKILGLTIEQAGSLFEPMNGEFHDNEDLNWETVTPRQAAKVLRNLAKTGEVDWEVAFA